MDDHKQRGRRLIAKNTIFNLVGQVLPMAIGVLTIPYIVRGLGTAQYGILSIAMMLLGYFNIFDLGLGRATVKFVAENLDPENIHKVPELIWTSLALLVGLGIIGAALSALFVPVSVTHFFKMPHELAGQARIALFVLCASMPVVLGNNALRGVLEATQRFDLVNYVKVPSSVLFYLAAALAIPFGAHVAAIVCLLVAVRLVSTLAYLFLCFRTIPGLRSSFRVSRASLGPLATFGGWIMVTNVYFSYHGNRKSSEVSEMTSRTLKYLLLVLTPPVAIFIFFARDIMQLWLGPQFAQASTVVLQLTTLICFVSAFAYVPYTSVQALGRPDLKAILDLIALPTYCVVAWWLIKHDGINGAAFAKLVVTVADCAILFMFALKLRAFSLRDCFSGPLFRAASVSAALFALVFAVESVHLKLLFAVPLIIICFLGYVLMFWIFAVDTDDRTVLRGLRERVLALLARRRSVPAMPFAENDAAN